MRNLLLSGALLLSFASYAQRVIPGSQDHYRSFSEMARNHVEGEDYSIEIRKRNSGVLVTAFHGGLIEPGTSELGDAIAGDVLDFYTFRGLVRGEMDEESFTSSTFHITSTRFDEPQLTELTGEANFCVGLHGFGGKEADFCVGGANPDQRKELVRSLSEAFPELVSCELCCDPYNGVSKKNPINRCKMAGVQIEMSPGVRRRILADKEFLQNLSKTFQDYLKPLATKK